MKIRYWQSVRQKNDWEFNLLGHKWALRIARRQIGFWLGEAGERTIFNWINKTPLPF